MSAEQQLSQHLDIKLSPKLLQLLSFIQTPNILLEDKLKEEVEKNIVLEFDETPASDIPPINNENKNANKATDEYNDGDSNEYGYSEKESYPELNDTRLLNLKDNESLTESLLLQIENLSISPTEKLIAQAIVGSLEDNGLLLRNTHSIIDDLLFKQNVEVAEETFLAVLKHVQGFEPIGIAATSVPECLLIQLEQIQQEQPQQWVALAKQIIQEHYKDFLNRNYIALQNALHLDSESLAIVLEHIKKLNPVPGNTDLSEDKTNRITPDFIVYWDEENLKVELTKYKHKKVRMSTYYEHLYQQYQAEKKSSVQHQQAMSFLKEKIDQAQALLDNVKSRDEILLIAMQTIVQQQQLFFSTGNEIDLKPLILDDIARVIKMSISTVSRIINSKFVQTDFGVFSLKFFFGEHFENKDGQAINAREIKSLLKQSIDNEDKKNPLTDEELANSVLLKKFLLPRRTIAKYRFELEIPIAKMRKQA